MKYIGGITFDDAIKEASQIVICGRGQLFCTLLSELEKKKVNKHIVAICDADPTKQGEVVNEIEVISYEMAVNQFPMADYVVYNKYAKEIFSLLSAKGIKNIHLISQV